MLFVDNRIEETIMDHFCQDDSSHSGAPHEISGASLPGQELGTSMETHSTAKSSSIPLPSSHVSRTQSELQLFRDEEAAELRDVNMFYRLVNGIRERHQEEAPESSSDPIASLVQTRLKNMERDDEERSSRNRKKSPTGFPRPNAIPVLIPPAFRLQEHHTNGNADGWSITGFTQGGNASPATTAQESSNDDEGDCVFSLDL